MSFAKCGYFEKVSPPPQKKKKVESSEQSSKYEQEQDLDVIDKGEDSDESDSGVEDAGDMDNDVENDTLKI